MKRTVQVLVLLSLVCGSRGMWARDAGRGIESGDGIPHCSPGALLILEQGTLAGVDWVKYRKNQVRTRTILTQSRMINATIDVRADGTASHSSVVLANAGDDPQKPVVRDLGDGAIYLSDMIPSSVEQAVARA